MVILALSKSGTMTHVKKASLLYVKFTDLGVR